MKTIDLYVSNQKSLDEKIESFIGEEANIRILHLDPLEGPVELRPIFNMVLVFNTPVNDEFDIIGETTSKWIQQYNVKTMEEIPSPIHQVVVKGGALPIHPKWISLIREQCHEAGVEFVFEGYGDWKANSITLNGDPTFRYFYTKIQWINKARTWMRPGDVCVDMTGKVLKRGADFDDCEYPIVILRPA